MSKLYCVLVNDSYPFCLETSSDGTQTLITEELEWVLSEQKRLSEVYPNTKYEVKEISYVDPVPKYSLEEITETGAGHRFISGEYSRIYNELQNRCAEFIPNGNLKAHNVLLLSSRIINVLFTTHFSMGMKYGEQQIKKIQEGEKK